MKNIVICADGTWNRPELFSKGKSLMTNVELMYESVQPVSTDKTGNIPQIRFYESGVGTSTYDKIDQWLGGVKGFGIDRKIKDIYTFLLMNYEKGDHIYLFGFSRGAYTVRSVAGMIRNCGILKPEHLHLLENAYTYYRDRNHYTFPESDFMKSFRRNYCVGGDVPQIHFIGVWDTVGSLGFPVRALRVYNNNKYKFHDVRLSSYVSNAYHAMAIDEKRGPFAPTLWEIPKSAKDIQVLEQMWFAGVHSNVGGGYPDCGLSDVAFEWMMEKAQLCGLHLVVPGKFRRTSDPEGAMVDSRSLPYKVFWKAHIRKMLEERKKKEGETEAPITNERISKAVWRRFHKQDRYRPKNLSEVITRLSIQSNPDDDYPVN